MKEEEPLNLYSSLGEGALREHGKYSETLRVSF